MRYRKLALVLLALATLSGCSDSRPVTYPVKGRVTYKGMPLTGVVVNIMPVDFSLGAYGKPDLNGEFDIVSSQGGHGVIPGTHRVFIGELEENASNPVLPTILGMKNMHFTSYENSNLTIEVKKGQNELVIDIE